MSNFFLILIMFQPALIYSQMDVVEARNQFPLAVQDEGKCREFIKDLSDIPETNYLLRSYRGAANIVMAKFLSSPNKRLQYFLKGKEDLDLGVEKMPTNVEIRYLRFRIQENTPAMLMYDDNDEDLPVLVARINEVKDPDYREKIRNFVLSSGKCTEEQERILKSK